MSYYVCSKCGEMYETKPQECSCGHTRLEKISGN